MCKIGFNFVFVASITFGPLPVLFHVISLYTPVGIHDLIAPPDYFVVLTSLFPRG